MQEIDEKKIRVVDMGFDPDGMLGLQTISLVEYPAIEHNWVMFSSEKVRMNKVNKERRMVFGPALIPDQLVYREDEQGIPYYARFKSAVIERMAHEHFKKNLHHGANLEHTLPVSGVYVAESWLKWSEEDKSNSMGFDLPVGTWFIGMKIESDEVWNKVLAGDVKGFSIEGMFNVVMEQYMPSEVEEKKFLREFEDMLKKA